MTMLRRHDRVAAALLALSLPAWMGCDLNKALDVDAPTQIIASTLDDPQKVPLLLSSMTAGFYCALGAYIVVSGEVGDLLAYVGGNALRDKYYARSLSSGLGYANGYQNTGCAGADAIGAYGNLQETRWYAADLVEKLEGWTDAQVAPASRVQALAQSAAIQGYTELLLGEGFCSMAFDTGPLVTREQVFVRAEASFTKAIQHAQAAGDNQILNMAYVGRARARLNAGNGAGAASDAGAVPATGFREETTQSGADPYRRNQVFSQMQFQSLSSVETYWRGYMHQGVVDPRMALTQSLVPREVWSFDKYPTISSPIPIARSEEAQLILAEVQGGQAAVAIINMLHPPGMPAFSSTDPAEILAHVIEERAIVLFGEGHRLGDMLRYNLPFRPAAGSPGVGSNAVFGTDTCMPLPIEEVNSNPNL